jgi:ribokinase
MIRSRAQYENVCVIGNLNMDLLVRGIPALPEWGREVLGTEHQAVPAGQAGYLALGLAALETPVSVISVLGSDEAGERIVRLLKEERVDATGITMLPDQQTGLTVALVRPDGERAFASNIGCSGKFTVTMLNGSLNLVAKARMVAIVGLFMIPKFTMGEIRTFLAQCRLDGRQTVVDTGWDPENWQAETRAALCDILREVDLFLPNLDEARAITGEADSEAALASLVRVCGGSVVIKCGAEGSLAWHAGKLMRHAAPTVKVIDAVGAGDSFNAGLMSALMDGQTMERALSSAHRFASTYVSRSRRRFASRTEMA